MGAAAFTSEILSYLRENEYEKIISNSNIDVKKFASSLKKNATSTLNISNEDWNSSHEDIYAYIRALWTIKYLELQNRDVYSSLFSCRNNKDIKNKLSSGLPENYSTSIIICKYMLKEVKYLKSISENDTALAPASNPVITQDEHSLTMEDTMQIHEFAILKKEHAEEIKCLHQKITELTSENSALKESNEKLTLRLGDITKENERLKSKLNDTDSSKSIKDIISIELIQLNKLLNSNSSESQITIKDEILNRVSVYIDNHNLIKIEDIITQHRDLKSEMIQIFILASLHQQSLL